MSIFKTIWARLTGTGGEAAPEEASEEVEHDGFVIRPTPYKEGGQYQVAGTIEKRTEAGVRIHRFVRADRMATRDDAVSFTVAKARQIIDQMGERMFDDASDRQG